MVKERVDALGRRSTESARSGPIFRLRLITAQRGAEVLSMECRQQVFRASSQPTQPRNSDRVTSPTAVAAFEDECRLPVIFCTPGNVLDPDSSFEKKTCTDPGHRYR